MFVAVGELDMGMGKGVPDGQLLVSAILEVAYEDSGSSLRPIIGTSTGALDHSLFGTILQPTLGIS